jgi:D-amino-acid dehydrogenase
MVVQGIKWMLDPDSPLYVRPSPAPSFVRFMLAMARHCTPRHFRRGLELNLALTAPCLELFDEWAADGVAFEEHRRGVLLAYEHRKSFEERRTHDDVFARFGYVPEALEGADLHDVEPALSPRVRYALKYEADRQIEPVSLTTSLLAQLPKVVANQPVTGFRTAHGRVKAVRTRKQTFDCDAVVLAAGAFTGRLATRLGARLPVRPGKGYSVHYPDPPTALRYPLTFEDAHVAVSPLNDGLRIAGTMEFAGFDARVRRRRVEAMKAAAAAGFGDWDPGKPHREAWAGLRPMTPDGLPIIGRLRATPNAMVATGHAMLGLTQAPATARAVRNLMRGEPVPDTIRALGPQRFKM